MYGSERALLDLLPPLRTTWDVAICCPEGPFAVATARMGALVFPSFTGLLHEKGKGAWLRAALNLRKVIKALAPDLIHVNQAGATRITFLAAGHKIPVVAHVRIYEDFAYLRARRLDERVRAVVCVSGSMKEEASRTIRPEKLFRLYDPYQRSFRDEERTPSANLVLCVGRLAKIKGQDLLLDALANLRSRGREVTCRFLGGDATGGIYMEELRSRTGARGLEGQVEWLGVAQDVFPELARAQAVVVPSEREPLGRVIFEAWDAGTVPIVWRGSGGAAEAILASEGGILFEERTTASLADSIMRALELPDRERDSLVQKGRSWLEANCSPTRVAEDMDGIWKSCIASKRHESLARE